MRSIVVALPRARVGTDAARQWLEAGVEHLVPLIAADPGVCGLALARESADILELAAGTRRKRDARLSKRAGRARGLGHG